MLHCLPPRLDSSPSQGNRNGGCGATSFSDFCASREMLRQERDIAKPRATGSRGESGRPIGAAVQGSAAAVNGRVSFLK